MESRLTMPEAFAAELEAVVAKYGQKINDTECITALEAQLDRAYVDACEPGFGDLRKAWAAAQEGYQNPVSQVALRAGFLICREYMARFVEQGGDASTAASIRANWIPPMGTDPGLPRRYDFAEVAEADDMETGPWRSRNPGVHVDAAVYAFCAMHALGLELPAEPAGRLALHPDAPADTGREAGGGDRGE